MYKQYFSPKKMDKTTGFSLYKVFSGVLEGLVLYIYHYYNTM